MPGFSFPLQQLLDLRAVAEDKARCALSASQREALTQRERLQQLSLACEHATEATAVAPGEPVQPGRLLNNGLHLAHLRARAINQQQRVEQSSQQESLRQRQLLEAAQQREVLERLKQRRRQTYLTARTQAETRLLDEAATAVFVRQNNRTA